MNIVRRGFTVAELAVVIVVIAILATIIVVSYSGAQERAQVAAISKGLTQVEDSLRLWALKEKFSTWPEEDTAGGGTPFDELIVQYPTLGKYLRSVPDVDGAHSESWFYDNEGDRKDHVDSCNTVHAYDGVNIFIRFVENERIARQVDEILDDGDISCGKVKYIDKRIIYTISENQSVLE